MKFIDAHIHLSDSEYGGHVNDIIEEAKKSNVIAMVSNSMDLKTNLASLKLAQQYPQMVYAALGIHPWTVKTLEENEFHETQEQIIKSKTDKSLVAIGEIGLDVKYMDIWDKQLKVFDSMLHLAERLGLPAIIHSRGTTMQIVDMLPSYNVKKVLLHWFSNPISALAKIVEKGYYITEGAPSIYSEEIRNVIKMVPLANLLTETDGPVRFFKSPFNGKRASPSFVPLIVKAIAEIKKTDVEDVSREILGNFEDFFGIKLN